MGFLYLLEDIRFPLLDKLMLFITNFGSMAVFLLVSVVLFWCIDKKKGYYFIVVGLLGTIINQFLKLFFRIPRPWILDKEFTIVEAARADAGGYSFPSGHTQSAVSIYAGIALFTRRSWLKVLAIVMAVLVPFSRMYLGVHTPKDVLVAAAVAILLVFLLKLFILDFEGKYFKFVLLFAGLLSAGHLCFAFLYQFPADTNLELLADARENALSMFGAILGLPVAYILDKKWINFSTKAVWWAQILKVVLGLISLLVVKEVLKFPLNLVFDEKFVRIIRYFFVVVTAGAIWPMTFQWFKKMGTKEK